MPQIDFAAQAYQSRSLPLDAQQCLNMFVERSPKGAKTEHAVFACAGLTVLARAGNGPINALHLIGDSLYAISGGALYSINQDGAATLLGQTTLGGIVSTADNETQLVMVDGFTGWVYQAGGLNQVTTITAAAGTTSITVQSIGTITTSEAITIALDSGAAFTTAITSVSGPSGALVLGLATALPSQATAGAVATIPNVTLGQITAAAFQPANTVVYFDDYFVFDAAGTNEFFISSLGDGTQYNGLDFASAQADPDLVLAIVNYHEQLLIMGQRTIEVWYDAGSANFPFARFDGAFIQRGLVSPQAIVKEDNTVFWLGEDNIFYRLNGYTPDRVSTYAMEHAWQQYTSTDDCNAFVITLEGHKFIFLNFPQGNATWCYDIASGVEEPLWHERESRGSPWV